ncbi:MAG: glutathione S-transferase family protein [Marinosulfonomonas sp.]
MTRPIVYHIPVCPFSQRLEILLALKGHSGAVEFQVVDITKSRSPDLLAKTRGVTALPVLETLDGQIVNESLVLLNYLDQVVPGDMIRRADPLEHAIESMLIAKEGPFTMAGYLFVLNQDQSAQGAHHDKMLALYRDLNDFLNHHNPRGLYLFDRFGLAEAVFAPIFNRFSFLEYYEGFDLPSGPEYDRVCAWRAACQGHPTAQKISREEIIKVYYDYAIGMGNGALAPGRQKSSFTFDPDWRDRPWPPKDKYGPAATDAELGLI